MNLKEQLNKSTGVYIMHFDHPPSPMGSPVLEFRMGTMPKMLVFGLSRTVNFFKMSRPPPPSIFAQQISLDFFENGSPDLKNKDRLIFSDLFSYFAIEE